LYPSVKDSPLATIPRNIMSPHIGWLGAAVMATVLVVVPSEPLVSQRHFVAREEARIGTRVEDTLFNLPHLIAARPKKGVIGVVSFPPEIFELDSLGRVIRRIGRQGKGPGEFEAVATLGVRGDSVWFYDLSQQRVTINPLRGREPLTVRIPRHATAAALMNDGSILVVPIFQFGSEHPLSILRYQRNGDSIGSFTSGRYRARDWSWPVGNGMLAGNGVQPLDDSPLIALCPDGSGVVIVDRSFESAPNYTVTKFAPDGTVTFRKEIRFKPRAATSADLDSVMARLKRSRVFPRGFSFTEAQLKEADKASKLQRAALWHPPHMPPVYSIVPAQDGRIWLATDEVQNNRRWIALNAKGLIEADLLLPVDYSLKAALGTTIWCTTASPDGEGILVRMRLQ
jgi:hypothetical protein